MFCTHANEQERQEAPITPTQSWRVASRRCRRLAIDAADMVADAVGDARQSRIYFPSALGKPKASTACAIHFAEL
jgi:hypothetical protein